MGFYLKARIKELTLKLTWNQRIKQQLKNTLSLCTLCLQSDDNCVLTASSQQFCLSSIRLHQCLGAMLSISSIMYVTDVLTYLISPSTVSFKSCKAQKNSFFVHLEVVVFSMLHANMKLFCNSHSTQTKVRLLPTSQLLSQDNALAWGPWNIFL